MKVYVTKYWESRGIFVVDVEKHNDQEYLYESRPFGDGRTFSLQLRLGADAFPTEADALDRVRKEAKRKVVALRKKIDKITREWLQ